MENQKRDMKWALELAIASMKNPDVNWDRKYLAKAADMLRNGGPVVEKSKSEKAQKCPECGALYWWNVDVCKKCSCIIAVHYVEVDAFEHWTEREKIQIVTEKSEPTFEEITHE